MTTSLLELLHNLLFVLKLLYLHSWYGSITTSGKRVIPRNEVNERHSLTFPPIVIVILISGFLKRYLKAKRTRAPDYSRTLRRIKGGFSKRGQEKLRSD